MAPCPGPEQYFKGPGHGALRRIGPRDGPTERACVWTLGGLLDGALFERLRGEAQVALRPFVDQGGMVAFAMPALLITAARAESLET